MIKAVLFRSLKKSSEACVMRLDSWKNDVGLHY